MDIVFRLLARAVSGGTGVLLIGGHALQAHGVSRQTVDVDALIAAESLPELLRVFQSEGFFLAGQSGAFARLGHPAPAVPPLDVLLVSGSTFNKLNAGHAVFRWSECELPVPAVPHLAALKLHAIRNAPERETKDSQDIRSLRAANPEQLTLEILESLCERFGPPGIFCRLKEAL